MIYKNTVITRREGTRVLMQMHYLKSATLNEKCDVFLPYFLWFDEERGKKSKKKTKSKFDIFRAVKQCNKE